MILILASKRDVASMNIARKLIDLFGFKKTLEDIDYNPVYVSEAQEREVKLAFTNEDLVNVDSIVNRLEIELLICASRHTSEKGIPTLSVHAPGNLTEEATLGGKPRKVSMAPAASMRDALRELFRLNEERSLGYEVSYECTHHGPSLDVPTMFIELGGSKAQWEDLRAAEAVAHAAMAAITAAGKSYDYSAALGVGGPHYNEKFTKVALSRGLAFGHIIPKYVIPRVDEDMLKQCVERTLGKVEVAVLDWKGIEGNHRQRIISSLKRLGLFVERV